MTVPPAYLRDWRRGDPASAKGLTLWSDNAGEPVWLSPNEVQALGLVEAMRARIEAISSGWLPALSPEETRSPDVRPPIERDGGVVPADEYFGQEALCACGEGPPDGCACTQAEIEHFERENGMDSDEGLTTDDADHAPGGRPTGPDEARVTFTERSALPEDQPGFGGIAELDADKARRLAEAEGREGADEPTREQLGLFGIRASLLHSPFSHAPSGEVDGWRWWIVRDEAGDALAYDNRPTVEGWRVGDDGQLPRLVQGSMPLAVALRAAAEDPGPLDGRGVQGAVATGSVRQRLGLDRGATDGEVEAALVGYRLGQLTASARAAKAWTGTLGLIQRAAEDLAGETLGDRPTCAIPWTDLTSADPVADVLALTERAREAKDYDGIPDYARADGRTPCHTGLDCCGRSYFAHSATTFAGGLVLHRLCDGRWVKL